MNLVRLALLFFMLACASYAPAQVQQSPPDPTRLDADWWNYFVPDPEKDTETLALQVEKSSGYLQALKTRIPADEQAELGQIIETIVSSLQRYKKFTETEPPVLPPAIPAQETYSLPEIRKLIDELRKAGVERVSESQDVTLLQNAVKSEESELKRRKVTYLALQDTAPERTLLGLELMQSRLQLELGKLELKWRKARLEALDTRVENLQATLKVAAQRLTSTAEAIDAAVARREEASKKAEALRGDVLKAQLAESHALALTPIEQARAQRDAQKLIALDAQATTEELNAAQAEIAEILLRRTAANNGLDPRPHRERLKTYAEELNNVGHRLDQWRQETARSRSAGIAQLADEEDRQIIPLLEERIKAADATERKLRVLEEQLIAAKQFGDLLDGLLTDAEGSVGRSIQLARDWAGISWDKISELASLSLFEISETPVTALGLLRVLVILTVAWWISKLVREALQRIATKRETVNPGSIYTLGRLLHYIILAIGIMIALSSIGIDFTKFALFASALGVGIGFGLQTLVSNFVAGLIILFEKHLKIGDFVELESGVTGEVKEINMRSTLITTNDNVDIVVPNSEFVNGRVTNWTMREVFRRFHIPFGVAYGTDKEQVKQAALEAAADVPMTLTGQSRREPQVWFVEFGDSSLNFELVVWLKQDAVKRPSAVQAAYLWQIDNKLRKYNIEVPFPQRDLHLRSVFGQKDDDGLHLLKPQTARD